MPLVPTKHNRFSTLHDVSSLPDETVLIRTVIYPTSLPKSMSKVKVESTHHCSRIVKFVWVFVIRIDSGFDKECGNMGFLLLIQVKYVGLDQQRQNLRSMIPLSSVSLPRTHPT